VQANCGETQTQDRAGASEPDRGRSGQTGAGTQVPWKP